jgi:hypothetical protein
MGVGDDLAGVVTLAQCASDEFVEVELPVDVRRRQCRC